MQLEDVGLLVIDDVQAMRVRIKELCRSIGIKRIYSAYHGEEAKAILDKELIHVVLSDWHMEPMDGISLLKHMRAHPMHQNIAFIMVSAENTREQVLEAVKSGVDDYIMKPMTAAQVQAKVVAVLKKKQVM